MAMMVTPKDGPPARRLALDAAVRHTPSPLRRLTAAERRLVATLEAVDALAPRAFGVSFNYCAALRASAALLGSDRADAGASAAAFLHAARAAGRRPLAFVGRDRAAGFDKRWLVALVARAAAGDDANVSALLRMRFGRAASPGLRRLAAAFAAEAPRLAAPSAADRAAA